MIERHARAAATNEVGGLVLRHAQGSAAIGGLSIAAAFRVAMLGARGRTRDQMMAVLKTPASSVDVPIAEEDGGVLLSASSVWADREIKVLDQFRAAVAEAGSEFHDADFSAEADKAINEWVARQTREKIKKLVPKLGENDRMVVATATYFRAPWKKKFSPEGTTDASFYASKGLVTRVRLMSQTCAGQYGEAEKFVAGQLPFAGGRFSMTFVVPRTIDDLGFVESNAAGVLQVARSRMSPYEKINVFIPRFKVESDIDLVEPLAKAGMIDAFSDDADFSGIDGDRTLYISKALHKAVVEVDEEGATAAGSTGIIMATRALTSGPPITLRADRTFLFAIRDEHSGTDVFVGRFDG